MSYSGVRPAARRAQILWIAAVLIVAAGYVFVFRTLEIRIAATVIDLDRAVASLERNAAIVRERPVLEGRRREADEQLGSLLLRADRATVVAEFVREASRVADVHGTRVTAIEAPLEADAAPAESRFDAVALDCTLGGSYRELLRTIRDLSHGRTLADLQIASVERTAPEGIAPHALALRLRVRVLRLRDRHRAVPASEGDPHVRP